jgi:phosphatidylserine/phosphatidylglycerophosphate/cardiolipin synthase-like enzyme
VAAALLLAAPPFWAAREAESLPPFPRPAAALFSSDHDAGLLLVRVYASAARDDEFVELGNAYAEEIDLTGWSLSDGEASAVFPLDSVIPPKGFLLVARNATSYAEDTLALADFTFETGEARRMEGGIPRLADAGDEVLLLDPNGSVVDGYAWGDSSYTGPGWTGRASEKMGRGEVAVRLRDATGAWIDRDRAEDWEGLRRHRLGQSAFEFAPFELTGRITAVLSPDDGDEPLRAFLRSAQRTIDVSVYTFASERIASVLSESVRAGVRVRVLLDGGPVGGIEDEELNITRGLAEDGAEVRWLTGGSGVVKRYRFLHAKYAVVDSQVAWIGSENFGTSGFPNGRKGNRGWSVVLDDAPLAGALERVFEADFDPRRRDSISRSSFAGDHRPSPTPGRQTSSEPGSRIRSARLIVGPEMSLDPNGVLALLASARERVSIEAFYIEDAWRNETNPFLAAAFEAARRGVSVRILLDGSWASVEAESGTNDDVLGRINLRAQKERLPLEARLLAPRGSIERLHNKGVVVDGREVLVSSMNWALGSATENREIGVILQDAEIAHRFEDAFDADWEGRPTGGGDPWRIEDPMTLIGLYALVAVASVVSLRKLRVGAKGIRPGARVRTRGSLGAIVRRGRREVRLLPPQLVAEPRARPGRGTGTGGRREEARGGLGGPERD